MRRELVFRELRVPGDFYRRWIALTDDGTLTIEGHDLTGEREYEFVRRVAPAAVVLLRRSLRIGDDEDLLAALRARFEDTLAIERHLEVNHIPTTFWNRIGE